MGIGSVLVSLALNKYGLIVVYYSAVQILAMSNWNNWKRTRKAPGTLMREPSSSIM